MSPEKKHLFGLWLIFGGFIPAVVVGAVANWAAKHRKLATKESRRFRWLLAVEIVTTLITLVAFGVVAVLPFIRIGAV